jgi:hypothetical protein
LSAKRLQKERAPRPIPGLKSHKLATPAHIRDEMARVYRLSLQGKIEPEKMTKLIYALKEIRSCIEMDVLDEAPRRLAELRTKFEKRDRN